MLTVVMSSCCHCFEEVEGEGTERKRVLFNEDAISAWNLAKSTDPHVRRELTWGREGRGDTEQSLDDVRWQTTMNDGEKVDREGV